MSSNVLMVPNCKEDNSANVRWSLLPLSISFLSHTHILTHPLSIIRTHLSFASSPEQWPSKFPGSLHWNVTNTVWHEGSPSSSVLESRSQSHRTRRPPLRSWTPLNISARPYKPACERLVSANSKATKQNFCSELKHLLITQLSRTGNKHRRAHRSQIKALSGYEREQIISTKSSHSLASFEFWTSSGYKISVS